MKIHDLSVSTGYLKTRLCVFSEREGCYPYRMTAKEVYEESVLLFEDLLQLFPGIAFIALPIVVALFNKMDPN